MALKIGTALLLAGVPLACSTWLAQSVEPPKLFLFRSAVVLVLVAWGIGLRRGVFQLPHWRDLNLPLIALFAWWGVRTLAAFDDPDSLDRLLTVAGLAALAVVWGSAGAWSSWLGFPVAALAVVTLYSWLQRLDLDPVGWAAPVTYPTMLTERTIATLGNPNYLGAFMVGVLPLALLLPRGPALFSLSLGTAVLVQNRSTWLALAVSLPLLLILLWRSQRDQVKPAGRAVAGGLTFALAWWLLLSPSPAPDEIRERPLAVAMDTRAFLWKSAALVGRDHPLAGVEPGDYMFAALPHRRLDSDLSLSLARLPEDPHNELLRILVETGVPGVLLALGAVVWGYRQHREPHRMAALTALLVNLLFVSASLTLQVLLVFLLSARDTEPGEPQQPARPALLAGGLLLWTAATVVAFGPVLAEYHAWWGDEYVLRAQAAPDQQRSLALYQEGIDHYRRALELSWPGRYPSLWISIGNAYAQAYEKTAALPQIAQAGQEAYANAARLEPAHPVAYAGIAGLLSLQARSQAEARPRALEMWQQALARDPHNPHYLATLGGELANGGSFEESARWLEESLKSYESPEVTLQYGRVLCRLGRSEEGRRLLEKARALDPTLAGRVQEALQECRNLQE